MAWREGRMTFITKPLMLPVSEQMPSDVLGDYIDFVVDRTVARHGALVPVLLKCPPGDADRPALTKIFNEILVERRLQHNEGYAA